MRKVPEDSILTSRSQVTITLNSGATGSVHKHNEAINV